MTSAFLLATLLALASGPLIYAAAQRRAPLLAFMDGFVLVSIAGLVMLEVVPGTFTLGGGWSIAFLGAGLFGPTLLERLFKRLEREAHIATLVLAIMGLILHTLADGAVLAPGASEDWALPLAVVLHSVPVGMAVWWLLAPSFGIWPPLLTLLAMGVGTAAGYRYGVSLNVFLGDQAWAWFQSLVAGSILHVIFGRPHLHHSEEHPAVPAQFEGLGNLLAIAALALISLMHTPAPVQSGLLERFMSLSLESAPALLAAYLIGGFVYGELPESVLRWLSSGGRARQSLRGMALGLPLPICSCSVLPLYQSLIRRGVPAAAALAFLIAAPEVGLTALFVSLPLLGLEMTLVRVGAAALLAIFIGYTVARLAGLIEKKLLSPALAHGAAAGVIEKEFLSPALAHGAAAGSALAANVQARGHDCASHASPSTLSRWRGALRAGLVDLVDGTAPWIVLGLVIAAAAEPLLTQMLWTQWPDALEVALFAVIGMPLYVCAAGVTPLIAVLLAAGVSPGAALAFLLTGPATNVATFGVLRSLHGKPLAWVFAVVAAIGALVLGLAVNTLPLPPPQTLDVAVSEAGPLEIASLILLTALYAASLLRRGGRAFLAELLDAGRPAAAN